MSTIARALLVTTLGISLAVVLPAARADAGSATRMAAGPGSALPPAATDAPAGRAPADEGMPTWAKWTLAAVALAAGVALLLAFVIVPAAVEDSVESFEPSGSGDGGSGDGGVL